MLLETLRTLEVSLHDPGLRCRTDQVGSLLHPAFREFGLSGAVYSREQMLAHLAGDPGGPVIWSQDFELEVLSDVHALLTYRSAHMSEDGELHRHAIRTSIWERSQGQWQLRFHQGTPAAAFEKNAT